MTEVEFSREADLTAISAKGRHYKFEATEEECAALAERFSILQLQELRAECFILPTRKKRYRLEANFTAKLLQSCVISLEPVKGNISGEFTIALCLAEKVPYKEPAEIDFAPDEEDIEFLDAEVFDVGEVIAQHLSLEINPYPRSQNVTGTELGQEILQEENLQGKSKKPNPFSVLKSLKHKT